MLTSGRAGQESRGAPEVFARIVTVKYVGDERRRYSPKQARSHEGTRERGREEKRETKAYSQVGMGASDRRSDTGIPPFSGDRFTRPIWSQRGEEVKDHKLSHARNMLCLASVQKKRALAKNTKSSEGHTPRVPPEAS